MCVMGEHSLTFGLPAGQWKPFHGDSEMSIDRWQAFSGTVQFFERSILHSPSPPSLFVEGAESGAGWELLFVASSLMSTALAVPKSKASLKIGMWGMVCATLM